MADLMNLNERIFAAMDELDAAKGTFELQDAIEKAKVKSALFGDAIKAANTMMAAARMQNEAMNSLAVHVDVSNRLLGHAPVEVGHVAEPAPAPALPEFDAVSWIRANGAGHSISWIRDRLGRASGRDYGFEEVSGLCAQADVVPVNIGKTTMGDAERESSAARKRADDGRG